MKHSENCQCPKCSEKRLSNPELLGEWYITSGGTKMTATDIHCNKYNSWHVNFVSSHPNFKSRRHSVHISIWNNCIKAWRKDLYPEGIENKGWRAYGEHKKRKS